MKTYTMYFIRNALTEDALTGRYIGHTDVPLSEEGTRQLQAMQQERSYPAASAVFSSPLKRCTQTAKLLYPSQNPILLDDLIEYDFGEFEGKTADELLAGKKADLFAAWLKGGPDSAPPFGENNAHFQQRVCETFAKIVDGVVKSQTSNVAIVTHGGVISTIFAAFAIPEAPMHTWMTPNGCGYTVRITPSLWMRCRKFEAIGLLPDDPSAQPQEAGTEYVWGDAAQEPEEQSKNDGI